MCIRDRNKSTNLYESVEGGAILNVTQDDLISTNINESVDDTTDEVEIVDTKNSKSDNVNVFNQLALMMEMMSRMRTEMKSENNNLNMSLNELKTEIKSENNKLNTSLDELKSCLLYTSRCV